MRVKDLSGNFFFISEEYLLQLQIVGFFLCFVLKKRLYGDDDNNLFDIDVIEGVLSEV